MKILYKIGALILLLIISVFTATAQIGFGTNTPDQSAVIDITSTTKGMFVPRMTQAQRDAVASPKNGLIIFNTTEGCFNYYSASETPAAWISLCGAGKAVIDCTGASSLVQGKYTQGVVLDGTNYINLKLNVTKVGCYEIKGTTGNGYSFYASGTVMQTGIVNIIILGQGKPTVAQTDNVTLTINGEVCTATVPSVTVAQATATYTMNCGSATVNGSYLLGVALLKSNAISLPVTVTTFGPWSVKTNTIDGISFSGSGVFASTGTQIIKLYGSGTPTSTTKKTMTLISDSQVGGTEFCSVDVLVAIPKKTVLHLGGYGEYNANAYSARNLMDEPLNFGTTATSKIKSAGFTHVDGSAYSEATIINTLTGSTPPDIVIIGYSYSPTAAAATALNTYLTKGGIVIFFCENDPLPLLKVVYEDNTIALGANPTGPSFKLPNIDDPVLNGPFGNIKGLYWGSEMGFLSLANNATITSNSSFYTTNVTANGSSITACKHKTKSFLWFGEGGVLSSGPLANGVPATNGDNPFATNSNNYPVAATAYTIPVYNSVLFANFLAWALDQSETNGINNQ